MDLERLLGYSGHQEDLAPELAGTGGEVEARPVLADAGVSDKAV
jgi:hypothetical protein